MLFNFCNAGEMWNAISAIATVIVVVFALYPILQEFFHKQRVKKILRFRLLFELNIIHESYFGKILKLLHVFKGNGPNIIKIPETDIVYFDKLEKLFEETIYISRYEKEWLQEILELFRKMTYRKLDNGFFLIQNDVLKIERLSCSLIVKIKGKLDIPEEMEDIRRQSYDRIVNAIPSTDPGYPKFDSILEVIVGKEEQ